MKYRFSLVYKLLLSEYSYTLEQYYAKLQILAKYSPSKPNPARMNLLMQANEEV